MKDSLGDIVLVTAFNPVTKQYSKYTFDMLPADGQLSIFQFLAKIPNQPVQQADVKGI